MSDVALDFVTTDELIEELGKRHAAMVFGGIELVHESGYVLRGSGLLSARLGLARILEVHLDRQIELVFVESDKREEEEEI